MAELILLLSLCRDARDLSADRWEVRHAAHRRLSAAGVRGVWAARLCADRSDAEARMRLHRLCGCHAAAPADWRTLPGVGLLVHGRECLESVPHRDRPAWLRPYYDRYSPLPCTWPEAGRLATADLVRDLRYAGVPRPATDLLLAAMRLRRRLAD